MTVPFNASAMFGFRTIFPVSAHAASIWDCVGGWPRARKRDSRFVGMGARVEKVAEKPGRREVGRMGRGDGAIGSGVCEELESTARRMETTGSSADDAGAGAGAEAGGRMTASDGVGAVTVWIWTSVWIWIKVVVASSVVVAKIVNTETCVTVNSPVAHVLAAELFRERVGVNKGTIDELPVGNGGVTVIFSGTLGVTGGTLVILAGDGGVGTVKLRDTLAVVIDTTVIPLESAVVLLKGGMMIGSVAGVLDVALKLGIGTPDDGAGAVVRTGIDAFAGTDGKTTVGVAMVRLPVLSRRPDDGTYMLDSGVVAFARGTLTKESVGTDEFSGGEDTPRVENAGWTNTAVPGKGAGGTKCAELVALAEEGGMMLET